MSINNSHEKEVKIKILPDGRKAILRPSSRYGCPVLEIQPAEGKEDKVIKIRYEHQ